jgi:hypothetical protein
MTPRPRPYSPPSRTVRAETEAVVTEPKTPLEDEPVDYPTCRAETFPVWADGSQDHYRCEEPHGHPGPHVGAGGDWSWSS